MKFSKFSELVNRILSNNHSHRRDMDVTIVVHSPGSIGSTPSVEVQSIHAGFDWDSGKVLIFPSQPLTTLTPEQITDITDSVRKGQSWHAYQEYKKHKEQLEKLSIELDAAKQRVAELEASRVTLAEENSWLKMLIEDHAGCTAVCPNCSHEEPSETDDIVWSYRSRETPATDAFLAEVRAQAFNDLCSVFVKDATVVGLDDGDIVTVKEATDALLHCAEQLRKGGNQWVNQNAWFMATR
ncbi:hypothetical protein J3Z65_005137 [Escherichia coli]|nr:hypothetical protein [Escherichia coli]ELW2119477.1 hypothetical protein [Escherichia coli]